LKRNANRRYAGLASGDAQIADDNQTTSGQVITCLQNGHFDLGGKGLLVDRRKRD